MKKAFLLVAVLVALLGSSAFKNSLLPATTDATIQWYGAKLKDVRDGDTIEVEFDDSAGFVHAIRLVGIDTPDSSDPCLKNLDDEATRKLEVLKEESLLIGLGSTNSTFVPYSTDSFSRLLGLVQTPESEMPIQVRLVQEGLARLDVRQNQNNFEISSDPDKFASSRPFEEYFQQIIEAQLQAAQNREGWWSEYCDSFGEADLVIAAIDFWNEPQVVYLLNRGSSSFAKLNQLELVDKHGNLLSLKTCSGNPGALETRQVLEIQTFNHLDESYDPGTNCVFDGKKIVWHVKPIQVAGKDVALWNKSSEEFACLALEGFFRACSEILNVASEGLYYLYKYPAMEEE